MRVGLSGVVGEGRGRNSLIDTGPEGKPGGESRFPLSLKTDGVFNTKLSLKKKIWRTQVGLPRQNVKPRKFRLRTVNLA